jgi:hypothetical protein
LSIKTKLIGGISALTLAGGMLAVAAPAANATVTQIGSCTSLKALGTAKSTTINPSTGKAYGITDLDNLDGTISGKGVDRTVNKGTNVGSCSFPVNTAQGVPDADKPPVTWSNGTKTLTKWSTKLFSREFDCDTTDTLDNTEWAPSGALSMTFSQITATSLKNESITAQITVDGFTDPDSNPATPSDVVKFHGIVTKGAALGSDVAGETEFDPTVADKTQTTATPYFGYAFDIGAALGCTTATKGDANITTFVNGSSQTNTSELLGLPVAGLKFNKGVA